MQMKIKEIEKAVIKTMIKLIEEDEKHREGEIYNDYIRDIVEDKEDTILSYFREVENKETFVEKLIEDYEDCAISADYTIII